MFCNKTRTYVLVSFLLIVSWLSFYLYKHTPKLFPFFGWATLVGSGDDSCPKDFHYSYFGSKDFFEKAYKDAPETNTSKEIIKGVLVNHHLLAPHLIAQTMNSVATNKPVAVVLVSPNHFSSGKGQIISSVYKWDTPYGVLDSDCKTIALLKDKGVLNVDGYPFKKEHGISGVVSFIKKSLPNSKIIPIIVKDNLSEKELNAFVDTLYKTLGGDTLIIGSFDFSHYLPGYAADFHDKQSISVIKNFDYEGLQKMDADSIPGLEIVMKYMQKEGANKFIVNANSNSARLINDQTIEETTSYINGSFSVGDKLSDSTATIISFGDMMLDRAVRKKIEATSYGYPFLPLGRFLMGGDIVVANLEGSFTNFKSKTVDDYNAPLQFTFDPKIIPTLKDLGFTLLSLSNNHSLNFGMEGLEESERNIEKVGLNWFGDPSNENLHSFTSVVRGQKITFIGYHQFANRGLHKALAEISKAKESGAFVVVYPHWGEEYKKTMTITQIDTAHKFIDSGADLIIGSHPHVIEPIEIYKGKAIFYSLGNFVFDQSNYGPTSEGLSVGVSLSENKVTYYLFPLSIRSAQASLMTYANRGIILNEIARLSSVDDGIKNQIKKGVFELVK